MIYPLIPIAFHLIQSSVDQSPKIEVIKQGRDQVALRTLGKVFPLKGNFGASAQLFYRVEPKEGSVIQMVYIWELSVYPTLENEHGKYYSFEGHRLEINPASPDLDVLPGPSWGFWGARVDRATETTFRIKKFDGMTVFNHPQPVTFTRVR